MSIVHLKDIGRFHAHDCKLKLITRVKEVSKVDTEAVHCLMLFRYQDKEDRNKRRRIISHETFNYV